jgi:hypothetical protein
LLVDDRPSSAERLVTALSAYQRVDAESDPLSVSPALVIRSEDCDEV